MLAPHTENPLLYQTGPKIFNDSFGLFPPCVIDLSLSLPFSNIVSISHPRAIILDPIHHILSLRMYQRVLHCWEILYDALEF